jgi:hypothetical protein
MSDKTRLQAEKLRILKEGKIEKAQLKAIKDTAKVQKEADTAAVRMQKSANAVTAKAQKLAAAAILKAQKDMSVGAGGLRITQTRGQPAKQKAITRRLGCL